VRMPRRAWPEELKPPAHHFLTSISLIRGRLTGRDAVMVIRVVGSTREIREAFHHWESCGFKVEEGARNGTKQAVGELGNHTAPDPSLYGRRSPSRGSRDLFSGATKCALKTCASEDE
jgi:hypothetical protein